MDIFEITGYKSGLDNSGVNFLDPADAFETLNNGYIYRQELLSRKGYVQFGNQLSDGSRVMGIFQNVNPQTNIVTTLACSKNYLYEYNTAADTWDQIPFGGTASAFGITNNKDYVSGTTYPDKTGNGRFVFCSRGMTDIYFYDGSTVQSFTADNVDYSGPSPGPLSRATYVAWFAERLNFFMPTLNSMQYPQSILYSGIRDASGNGDKFNVTGSGRLDADTYEIMKGVNLIADYIVLNFQRSNWTLRQTSNKDSPYFLRRTPSVLGTDASFSSVAWNNSVYSIGKTGVLATDGRESVKVDDKIPYFTFREFDADQFDLTYGGFDRINGQFLFAYRSANSELSDITQDKVLVYNYDERTWAVNDQRFSVFGQSDDGESIAMNDIFYSAEHPSWGRMDTTEEIWNEIGTTAGTQKTLAGDNDGWIYQINTGFNDNFSTISSITKAFPCVVTISENDFEIGDMVGFLNIEGMTELNNNIYEVTASTSTTITINVDSTNYSTYTTGGTVEQVIEFDAELTIFNPYRAQGMRCYISHIEVLLNTESNPVYVDFYIDGEESPYKTVLLSPDSALTKSRQWITAILDMEANFHNIKFRNQSYGAQTIITSVRMHCNPGGLTSG